MEASDGRWREAYQAAQRAWPNVTLAFERFVAHAAEVGFSLGAGEGDPDATNAADLFLACACGDGDPPAIAASTASGAGSTCGATHSKCAASARSSALLAADRGIGYSSMWILALARTGGIVRGVENATKWAAGPSAELSGGVLGVMLFRFGSQRGRKPHAHPEGYLGYHTRAFTVLA
jgi:hypothetical protein